MRMTVDDTHGNCPFFANLVKKNLGLFKLLGKKIILQSASWYFRMKSHLTILFYLFIFFTISFSFGSSCSKDYSRTPTDNQQQIDASKNSGTADGQAEVIYNEIFDDAMGVNNDVGIAGTGVFGRLMSCPSVVEYHPAPTAYFPAYMQLNFTDAGCVGNDGHLRRGTINNSYTKRLTISGAVCTTSFQNFYIDSIKVEGTQTITNISNANVSTERKFTVDITNAKLTFPSGNYIQWSSHKTVNQTDGITTPDNPHDDVFAVSGSANGQALYGSMLSSWQSTILTPLVKRYACRWLSAGKVQMVRTNTPSNGPWVAVLDYGSGNCDNLASISIYGSVYYVVLP
jgi:hypothetical protein